MHVRRPRPIARAGLVVLLGAGLAGTSAAPASAAPTTVSSVTVVSETGEFVGGGQAWMFSANSGGTVRLTGGPAHVTVDAGATAEQQPGEFTLQLVAPAGEVLQRGTYEDVHQAPLSEAGRAGLYVSGNGHGCSTRGRFTVLDIAHTDDRVDRLHALYEQECTEAPALPGRRLFGEIRYQVPAADSDLLVAAGHVQWPLTDPGVPSHPVPVTLVNTGAQPVELGAPRVEQDPSSSFGVVHDGCPDQLAVGASCRVHVRFTPAAGGLHSAVLAVDSSTATGVHRVQLSGRAEVGTTAWRMRSQKGDWVGAGAAYEFTPANALIEAGGSEAHVRLDVLADGERWTAEFAPGRNDVLLPGRTYDGALRYPFHYPHPGLSVVGGSRGCRSVTGRFTVHEIAFGREGLDRLSVTFEQHCEGQVPALLGSISYRATHGAAPLPRLAAEPTFSDIAGDAHEDAIRILAGERVVTGHADGTYRPREAVTRGQMASFLSRALDLPPVGGVPFSDTADDVHREAIDLMAATGIAQGYADGTYRPGIPVNRGQMAAFLARALALPPGVPASFTDTAGTAHAEHIDALAAAGLTAGYGDGTFRPADPVSRGQMASFLVRALGLSA